MNSPTLAPESCIMRCNLLLLLLVSSSGTAFIQKQPLLWNPLPSLICPPLFASFERINESRVACHRDVGQGNVVTGIINAVDFRARLEANLNSLRAKDATSPLLTKDEIKFVYEDLHIVVVDKPSGVLSVKGQSTGGSMAQAVHKVVSNFMEECDDMVVHRLGMDTSGLMVFAKTPEAVRGMNYIFLNRQIERTYEALVVGHMAKSEGFIDLPLMRDYECPPFMRISTMEQQRKLLGFHPTDVDKKFLGPPKPCLTKYEIVAEEEFNGKQVTRVSLNSITGRTHQLNVHLAALGHPIVGDSIYSCCGLAAPNGGLSESIFPASITKATTEVQMQLIESAKGKVCSHAKLQNH